MQSAGHGLTARALLTYKCLRVFLCAILCVALALKASLFFYHTAQVVRYPYEWSTMDGYYVYYGMRLLEGLPIYFGYDSLLHPFEYVPLYPVAIGALASIFGPGVWYERCFGIACSVGIAALVGFAVNRRTGGKFAGAAAGLMFFGPAAISVWYVVRGIDIFAAFLALAGVVVASEFKRNAAPRLFAAVVIFVLAFYAKQTAIFPAAAAMAFVFLRDVKKGILMGGAFCFFASMAFVAIQALSGGWFWENAFATTAGNPYATGRLLFFLRDYFIAVPLIFPIACIQAARGVHRRPDIWTLYFLFTLLAALLAGKAGAALSYFVPLYSATCICFGLVIGDKALAGKWRGLHIALLLVAIAQVVLMAQVF